MFKSTKYNDLAKQVKDVSKVKSRVTAVQVEAKAFAVTSKNKQQQATTHALTSLAEKVSCWIW